MWEVARDLAAYATNAADSTETIGGDAGEEDTSFKQQIEIPLAVSFFVTDFVFVLPFFFIPLFSWRFVGHRIQCSAQVNAAQEIQEFSASLVHAPLPLLLRLCVYVYLCASNWFLFILWFATLVRFVGICVFDHLGAHHPKACSAFTES